MLLKAGAYYRAYIYENITEASGIYERNGSGKNINIIPQMLNSGKRFGFIFSIKA